MEDQPPTQPRSFWTKVSSAVSSPLVAISDATKKSPAVTLIAILLVVQPVVQTCIDLVKGLAEVKHDLDPSTRPVTKAELDIVNQKIDFNNQLILAGIRAKATPKVDKSSTSADNHPYSNLQQNLTDVQKKLDADYKGQKK